MPAWRSSAHAQAVKHSAGEYVRGQAHVNGLESPSGRCSSAATTARTLPHEPATLEALR